MKEFGIYDISKGDHILFLYDDEKIHRKVIVDYIKDGLSKNEQIFYIYDTHSEKGVKEILKEAGLSIFLEKKQIVLLETYSTYLEENSFDKERMLKVLEDTTRKAIENGYSGLRITGETGWLKKHVTEFREFAEYEEKANMFFDRNPAIALCQYRRSDYSPDFMMDILKSHPYILFEERIYKNFYYIPPDVDEEESQKLELDLYIKNLKDFFKVKNEIEEARDKAENANKFKSQFLSNMSHELRTPMNGVLGMLELLLTTKVSTEQKEYVYHMRNSIDNLVRIINDVLDISKIESGKMELDLEEYNFENFMSEVYHDFSAEAHMKSLELISYIEPGIDEYLVGDFGKLRQILSNLISNAIKFTDRGEILVSVCKCFKNDKNIELEFRIKDTGIGIEEGKKEKIFDVFMQGDLSYTKKYKGTGLGLSISKKFVNMMGGEIDYKSITGIGTEFIFSVNLNVSDKEIHNLEDLDFRLDQTKILLIDDNYLNRKIAKRILKDEGALVDTARDGKKALEMLKSLRYNVILLDVHMPIMDGFEFLDEFKEFDSKYGIPVLMFSSVDLRDRLSELNERGVFNYLMKPIKRKDLCEGIKKAINRKYSKEIEADIREINRIEENSSKVKVLLVEDNELNVFSTQKMLEKLDLEVDVARNGFEALDRWENFYYPIIFMDIQMPEMNGFDATLEIRKREEKGSKKSKIIAITAYALSSDKEKIILAGFDEYLSKPFKIQELKKIVEKYGGIE